MEMLVKLALFVCFCNLVSGSMFPFVNKLESKNVLVPQNDHNLRESVKNLELNGEDEDITENDINDINAILPDVNLNKIIKKYKLYENKIDVEMTMSGFNVFNYLNSTLNSTSSSTLYPTSTILHPSSSININLTIIDYNTTITNTILSTTSSSTSTSTTTEHLEETIVEDFTYDLLGNDDEKECALGRADFYLSWVNEDGTLKINLLESGRIILN